MNIIYLSSIVALNLHQMTIVSIQKTFIKEGFHFFKKNKFLKSNFDIFIPLSFKTFESISHVMYKKERHL